MCQSKCSFCYNPTREYKIPSIDKIRRIVKRIKLLKIPHVQLTGGEVTLLPFINKIIEDLSKVSAVSIVTNGIKKVDLSKKLLCLYVSLHGSNPKIHERLTRTPGTYKIICRNIESYVEEGFDVSADTILTSINYKDIYKIGEKAKQLGMKRMYINRFELGGLGSKSFDLLPTIQQFKYAINEIIRVKEKLDFDVIFGTAIPFCLLVDILPEDKLHLFWELSPYCGAGIWHVTIDPNGNIKLCNQAPYYIGNILSNDLNTLWTKSKIIKNFRSLRWLLPICKKCPAKNICRGGCCIDASCSKRILAKTDIYLRYGFYRPNEKTFKKLYKLMQSYKDMKIDLKDLLMEKNRIIERTHKSKKEFYLVNPSLGVLRIK